MTETRNPYEAPRAAVVDEPAPPITGRPGWVWVICMYNVLGVVGGIAGLVLGIADPEAARSDWLDLALTLLESVLLAAFTVQLFRMRRNALTLGVASLVFSFAMYVRHATDPEFLNVMTPALWITVVVTWALAIVIVLYVRSLFLRGALRA